jgi:hypothetical protein
VVAQEGCEALLQRAALATGWLVLEAIERNANFLHPPLARIPLDQVPQREPVPEFQEFHLPQEVLDYVL